MSNKHQGSSFDEFLKSENLLEEVKAKAEAKTLRAKDEVSEIKSRGNKNPRKNQRRSKKQG